MFQGFGDPARMIVGQTGDKKTMDNIRKDLYLDQPKWKQFMLYLNDVSPICFHSQADIDKKKLNLQGLIYILFLIMVLGHIIIIQNQKMGG